MDRFTATMKTIASFIAIILVAFLFLNVILRYVFSEPFVFTEEVTGYLLASIVFLGLGYTLKTNGHVITDVLTRHFSKKTKDFIKYPIILGGIIFAIFFNLSAWTLMIKNFTRKTIDYGSLGTPNRFPTSFL